uniref:Uncharacterized protein n=1 Tax=Panagrolaimus sp. ES5 TaxID=591445 RepID=A0AC34GKD3_9BILA
MKQIPSPEYISQYLSHLGLPAHILNAAIFDAYRVVGFNPKNEWCSPVKDLEDPFAFNYPSEFGASSSNLTPPDAMPFQQYYHEKPSDEINQFQPLWFANTSSTSVVEEHTAVLDSTNEYSLFGETFPSAFCSALR